MGFEVPLAGVDRRSERGRRAVAVALLAFATLVGLAVATSGVPPARSNLAAGSGNPSLARTPEPPARTIPRALPAEVVCRDVDRVTCLRMAKAAVLVLPDDVPDAIDATVWRSLVCNDSFDCPRGYIDGSAPLGSVIIRFADGGPRAAVNVVEGLGGPIRRAPRAWVVRWMPEPG
jgi:hypothetical protein